jgi:lipoprotein NlpD
MKHAGGIIIFALLGGCIPPGRPTVTSSVASDETQSVEHQRIDPEMETLFDEQPVWEMRPVEANATQASGGSYVVQTGDTLRGIGEKTGAGSEALAKANGLVAPFVIKPGQQLIVPEGVYHRVGAGETGIAIARAYGTQWPAIIALNELTEPFVLRIGQRLRLPATAKPQPFAPVADISPDIEQRAAAFRLDIDSIDTGGEPAIESATQVAFADPSPSRALPPNIAVAVPSGFSGGFVWPTSGKVAARFGRAGEGEINQGIEIDVSQRAEIRTAGNGVVAFVGDNVANYGGVILVRHGDGWITTYGRVAQALVTRGQKVSRGQAIGYSGSGSAPRLFFQMRKNRIPVDPLRQLPLR